jgi:hypothetical protein
MSDSTSIIRGYFLIRFEINYSLIVIEMHT